MGSMDLALLAGCDVTPGATGVGAEKALQCVKGLFRQCDGPSVNESLLEVFYSICLRKSLGTLWVTIFLLGGTHTFSELHCIEN